MGCAVSVWVPPPLCTCSPTSTHVQFPPPLISSHCTVVVVFLKEKLFSASFNPRVSRRPGGEDHGVCIPLRTILWGSLRLWHPLGSSFPSQSPYLLPSQQTSAAPLAANSLRRSGAWTSGSRAAFLVVCALSDFVLCETFPKSFSGAAFLPPALRRQGWIRVAL